MTIARLLLANAVMFGLAASRIAGFVVVSPFPGKNVATTQRVGLVVVLAWIVTAFAPAPSRAPDLGLGLVWAAVPEIGCGLVIGVAFHFVFATTDVLGAVVSQMTGHGTPSVLNPTLGAAETPLSRAIGLVAMLVALSLGVHRVALSGLLESFRAIPPGTAMAFDAPAVRYIDLAIDSFIVGVRLAMPVVAVALVVHIALALVSRAAPSLQLLSVGVGVLFVATGATFFASLGDVFQSLAAHFSHLAAVIDGALTDLRR